MMNKLAFENSEIQNYFWNLAGEQISSEENFL